jgi:hypothetical protein
VARETSTIYGSEGYSLKLTGATAAAEYAQQRILTTSSFDDGEQGKPWSLGCWVWCASGSSARVGIYDGVGTDWCDTYDDYTALSGGYHPGDSAWHWLEATRTLDASATQLVLRMETAQAIVAYFSKPTLIRGEAAPARWIPSSWAYYVCGPGVQQGDITVTTYLNGWRHAVPLPMVVLNTTLQGKTAPTGAAAIYDVNKGGTSMYSTLPQIADAASPVFGEAAPDGTYANRCLDQHDVLSIDCDQIGSGTAGEDVNPQVVGICFPHPFAEIPATLGETK